MMENTRTAVVVFTNYKSDEDLKIGTKEIKTVVFCKSELDTIPAELLDQKELQNVIFNDCRFTHVEDLDKLKVCQNLTKLSLKKCKLKILPDFLLHFHKLETLDMSGNSFQKGLPNSMTNLRNLETLDISRCRLQKFPLVLNDLRTLKILKIEGNVHIGSLNKSLRNLTNLETLNVSYCGLSEFPQVLCKLKCLKELHMRWNEKIRDLPDSLENLANLETLNVAECDLTRFPHVLCKIKSLKALNIGWNNRFHNLPDTLENLVNLEILDVSHCGLAEFPTVLCKIKSLKALHIGWNKWIQTLPDSLEHLTNLEILNVSECTFREFPQVLCKLKSLKALHIRWNNRFHNLPDTLEKLANLEILDVSHCGLTEFPTIVCKLKSLKALHIGWNKWIQTVPDTLENLTNLEILNMSECTLREFPQVLCKLKSLKALHIGWNKIQNLPDTLEKLTNLQTLNMSDCRLAEFPEVLCKLKSLKALHIGWNEKIQNLPDTLENLTNLETLNMLECALTEFPKVLCKLKSLNALHIGWNTWIQTLPDTLENLTNLETLNMSHCAIVEFFQVLFKLNSLQDLNISSNPLTDLPSSMPNFEMKWLHKLDISNTLITRLPRGIERCRHLQELDISFTQIKELPTVIFTMRQLVIVRARDVSIEVLNEDFVKLWLKRPDILTEGRFQKMVGLPTLCFVKPPAEIVWRGPEACREYYIALRHVGADNAVNCSLLYVTLVGKTGAGKSSLAHSIKEGSPVLIDPSDRTVVVDTLEVKHEDILLKIADFGGHDIYEMTCPLFLKSMKQVAMIAVKLSEYNESNHDELVTKWLTTVTSHMKSGSVCIVATQCDLCTEDEVMEKMMMLKEKVHKWIEEELSFRKKLRPHLLKIVPGQENILENRKIHFFQSSSMNMKGVHDVEDFLFHQAKFSKSVLPKHWTEVYKKMDAKTAQGAHYVTETEYQSLFKTTYPTTGVLHTKLDPLLPRDQFSDNEQSLQCLQFLHDSGMVLWYGEKHKNLRNIIFHNTSFPVSVLQCLFRHDLAEVLEYDHDQFGQYFTSKSNFQAEVTRFIKTGIFSPQLLTCVWQEFKFSQGELETMVEMLTMLDICFIDGENQGNMLRIPWFIQDENMNFLTTLWAQKLPWKTLQYTLTYCFCHRIPGVIYERFCVRLQRHLQAGAHTRQDRKDAVYIEQNGVQIFFQRHPRGHEPYMQIHLRCSLDNLLQLQKMCLALHNDMDNLCSEYSGLYIDSYFPCPHCLLTESNTPTKRPIADIVARCERSLELVPCDPTTPGSIQIPAALIFLRLFGKSFSSRFSRFRCFA